MKEENNLKDYFSNICNINEEDLPLPLFFAEIREEIESFRLGDDPTYSGPTNHHFDYETD